MKPKPDEELSYRALYDLACYESLRGDNYPESEPPKGLTEADWRTPYDQALRWLEMALQRSIGLRRRNLLDWAEGDPTLAGVRNDPTHQELFSQLIEEFLRIEQPPASPGGPSEKVGSLAAVSGP